MNKTFKVARSLTRGTVVTSEKASSYQGKAVKTVIAAAVSALMLSTGAAMAEEAATENLSVKVTASNTLDKLLEAEKTYAQIQIDDAEGTKVTGDTLSLVKTGATGPDSALFSNVKGGTFEINTVTVKGAYAHGLYTNQTAGGTSSTANLVAILGSFDFQSDWKDDTNKEYSSAIHSQQGDLKATIGTMTGTAGHAIAAEQQWTSGTTDAPVSSTATVTIKESLNFKATNAGILATVRNQNQTASVVLDATDASVTLSSATDAVLSEIGSNKDSQAGSGTASVKITAGNVALTGVNSALKANGSTTAGNQATIDLTADAVVLKATNAAGSAISAAGNAVITINADTLTVNDADTTAAAVTMTGASTLNLKSTTATLTGAIKGDTASKMNVETTTLTIGDASAFKGAFNQSKGTTNVKATEFFGGSTTIGAKGSINLTDLNSVYLASLGDSTHANDAKDQFLLTGDRTLTLEGGSLLANGAALERIKVGSGSTEGGTLNVKKGEYAFTSLVLGQSGTVEVAKEAALTLDTLDLTGMNTTTATAQFTNSGSLTIGKIEAGTVNADKFTNAGKLYTSYENLFTKNADGKYTAASSFGTALTTDAGTTFETAYDGNIKASEWQSAKTAVGNIVFTSATLVGEDGKGNAELKDVDGLNVLTATVNLTATAENASAKVSGQTTIGSVVVKQSGSTAVTSVTLAGTDKDNQLIVRGTSGEFLTFDKSVDATKVKTITLDAVTLGEEATDGAKLDKIVNVGASGLKVAAGDWTLADVAGVGDVTVVGGGLTLLGTTTENKVGDKTYTALDFGNAKDNTYTGNLTVNAGSYLALGDYSAEASAALASIQSGLAADEPKASVIYIGQQILSTSKTNFATPTTRVNAHNNYVVVDLESVAATAGFDKTFGIYDNENAASNATVKAEGVNADVLTIGENGVGSLNLGTGLKGLSVEFGNVFYQDAVANDKGVVDVLVNDYEVSDMVYAGFHTRELVKNAVETYTAPKGNVIANTIYTNWGAFEEAADQKALDAVIAAGLVKEGSTYDTLWSNLEAGVKKVDVSNLLEDVYEAAIADVVAAEHAATNMAVAGGAFTAALDYNDQVTAALDRRTSLVNAERVQGFTPWVDVFGTTNEAKRLYGNGQGYESDIYGAVLGFDYTAACGGVFGVAFNVGTGDGNSVGSGYKVDNDADYYGFSAYGAYSTGMFNVKADIGYTQASNDLSTSSAYFGSVKESLDADIFTVGVGTEVLVKAGAFNVVPHAGIRLNRLAMDDSKYGADYDDMTVYQLALGVAVSSTFETNGWKVAPMADVSVVPTFGDKDAVASYFGGVTETTRVVDTSPVQGTLGVEAQNGAFTFGLNYRLTAGGDDRLNNSFNANVRYSF